MILLSKDRNKKFLSTYQNWAAHCSAVVRQKLQSRIELYFVIMFMADYHMCNRCAAAAGHQWDCPSHHGHSANTTDLNPFALKYAPLHLGVALEMYRAEEKWTAGNGADVIKKTNLFCWYVKAGFQTVLLIFSPRYAVKYQSLAF